MATRTPTTSTTSPAKKPTRTRISARKPQSRAVVRDVEAGSSVDCSRCGERVKFQAKVRNKQVICNVYIRGKWDRVEHFHAACYDLAGHPFGEAEVGTDHRRAAANAAAADRAKQLARDAEDAKSA